MTTFRNDPRIKIIKVCPKQETLSINKVIVSSPLPEDGKGQLTDWLAGKAGVVFVWYKEPQCQMGVLTNVNEP